MGHITSSRGDSGTTRTGTTWDESEERSIPNMNCGLLPEVGYLDVGQPE